MTIQPTFHWQFDEREGNVALDAMSKAEGRFHRATLGGHGRIGHAVRLHEQDSRISFGNAAGQFGTGDFTVAFGVKILNNHGQNDLNIIGNRSVNGHGNWFSLRLEDKGRVLSFEVDEDSKGKNFAVAKTPRLSALSDMKWHHIALVRKGPAVKVYFDGVLSAQGTSSTGVANISGGADTRLGHHTKQSPVALYEDLRIYLAALDAAAVKALVPSANRPLRSGEIELIATDGAAVILAQDVEDLSRLSPQFQKLRFGADTGATLYKGTGFDGVAQKLYADIPDTRLTRLAAFPQSIQVWPAAGEPFTGKWVIKAPDGQYLSRTGTSLATAPNRSLNELFLFHHNTRHGAAQLIPAAGQAGLLFKVGDEAAVLLADSSESHKDAFSIVGAARDRWLKLEQPGRFAWTPVREDRAIFHRVAKMADDEGQAGELSPGEVALYENTAYWGRTWILSDSQHDVAGNYLRLSSFHGLDNQVSSIRLGPGTGASLFVNEDQQAAAAQRETAIEDIVESVPDLAESQVGSDTISSIRIFRKITAEDIFTSYTTKLSQDYRMVGNELEEFSAYRTTLRFEPGAGEVVVSATDLTTIEVDGATYEIDEVRSVTLKPNELNFIMITSEADGLDTPGLKIRTSDMALNEVVVIFPNQEVHRQIAELEADALWNAKDAQGNLIVDQKAHSKEEVASVQSTIKRAVATVAFPAASTVASDEQVVSGAAIGTPWELTFKPAADDAGGLQPAARAAALKVRESASSPVADKDQPKRGIQEEEISQDAFVRLLGQAAGSEEPQPSAAIGSAALAGAAGMEGTLRSGAARRGKVGRRIRDAIKKATSVVVGAVEGIVHILVKTAEGIIDFVIDSAQKVAEFVEAVVEKVVNGFKKFIEFLQFLFNWDDILDTQRYLVGAINAGFDYAARQVEAAKAPVSAFVDKLQDTVKEGMNELVSSLGGEPSEVRKSGFKLPEAAEWFLSKLLGGAKSPDASPASELVAQATSGGSGLTGFASQFAAAFEDTAGAALRQFEGLGEATAALVANPLKPQRALVVLIEALRDAVLQLMDSVEHLALGFLDVLVEAIEQIKKVLNAEIRIPFISQLFKRMGAGKLTPLNLAALLLAIPATVMSKLVFGDSPFKDEPPLDFSDQPAAKLAARQAGAMVAARPKSAEETSDAARRRSIKSWGIIGLTADCLNGFLNAALDFASGKAKGKSGKSDGKSDSKSDGAPDKFLETIEGASSVLEIASLVLSGFSWLASFPSSRGFPGGRPYNLAAHKASGKPERWERVMWAWRTSTYFLDVVILLIKAKMGNGLHRLRRGEAVEVWCYCGFSVVDLIFTITYLALIPEKDNSHLESGNEVVALLPNILAPMHLFRWPYGAGGLATLDLLVMAVNTGMGGKLLKNDLADLAASGTPPNPGGAQPALRGG